MGVVRLRFATTHPVSFSTLQAISANTLPSGEHVRVKGLRLPPMNTRPVAINEAVLHKSLAAFSRPRRYTLMPRRSNVIRKLPASVRNGA